MPWELLQSVDTDILAIHAALLPTSAEGDILCFGDWTNAGPLTHWRLYHVGPASIDPYSSQDLGKPDTNAFCGGQAFLTDGRLILAGGTKAWPEDPDQMIPEKLHEHHYNGERACWQYLPRTKTWNRVHDLNFQPGSSSRGGGRWYPTLVTLPDGQVFAAGGHPATGYPDPNEEDTYNGRHNNNTPERYSPGADDWTLMTADVTAPGGTVNDSYPRFHLLPSGGLFSDTKGDESPQRIFDPFTGHWTGPAIDDSALPGFYSRGSDGTSVLLPLVPPNYKPRVVVCNSPDPTAFRIDIDESQNPAPNTNKWVGTVGRQGSAAGKRRNHCCAVLLPTGQVFLSGGVTPSGQENVPNTPVLEPELYTPGMNWTTGAFSENEEWATIEEPATVGRGYHSVALLLPDGRVWTAGSTEGFGETEKRIEIFSPSYVGQARPTLAEAPPSVSYGQQFPVTVGQGNQIQRVALMRCGSITHAFDSDQRYVGLNFTQEGTSLTVTAPPNPDVAPPGFYMLWVINTQGRPCHLAKFVRLSWQKALISADISTYSVQEVEALGTPASFNNALYLAYDGFLPDEVSAPDISIRRPDNSQVPGMTQSLGAPLYEAGTQAKDSAQRIVYPVRITFTSQQAFEEIPESEDFQNVTFKAAMRHFTSQTTLVLSKNPNPRMRDGDPHWLSIDLRTFTARPGEAFTAGVTHGSGSNAPYEYIQDVLDAYNKWKGGSPHPFDLLPTSQQGNPLPLYSEDDEGKLYNYAVAQVRFVAPHGVKAEDVRVFFRLWTTGWTGMSYNEQGSHRRSGDGPNAVPLLGLTGNEINNIPCFAEPRAADMEAQQDFKANRQTLKGAGAEEVHAYFGCWLDFNQDVELFPLEPGPNNNGPYSGDLKTIQELMRGLHQCLVAEIHYLPDPNHPGDTPASSDNLAQRNILLDETPNPGGFGSHLVHHTFEIKPSPFPLPPQLLTAQAATTGARLHPDELAIHWGNLPRDSHVTFYLPQVDTDEVLRYAALRQGPGHLQRAGEHTLRCQVADVSFIPFPGPFSTNLPGLMSIQLPPNLTKGQTFNLVVRQVDGRTYRVIGTFQFTITVKTAEEVLPGLKRNLSVLKHIALSIPATNRWYPVFERYLAELGERVRALGGNPDEIAPSPTGSGRPAEEPRPERPKPPAEVRQEHTGKVASILYDCFGDFEGFVLDSCSERRVFRECERALEEVVRRACRDRSKITLCTDGSPEGRVLRVVVHCC